MRIRLRAPAGASVLNLADDANVGDLLDSITTQTAISSFDIKYGYPSQPLPLDQKERTKLLKDLDVRLNGEQLTISSKDAPIIESKPPPPKNKPMFEDPMENAKTGTTGPIALKKRQAMQDDPPEVPFPEEGAKVVLRVMPDDNSCLFRAFSHACLPGDDLSMLELRSIIASTIQSMPEVYSAVVLEQPPDDYCRWIQTADAWGGSIELGILANYFGIEICSIDVEHLRVDRYTPTPSPINRIILIYSGIHYDTLVQAPANSGLDTSSDQRVWPVSNDIILEKAMLLCNKLKEKRYFTNTGSMKIKCEECGAILHGQGQANGHASQFGHYNMQEVIT